MEFIADLHIHSKYSRATSKDMDIKNLARWAKLKGITLLGTGDFTHHLWLEELKGHLESKENGLFIYEDVHFMLTAEISCIYSKAGKTYRVHLLVFAPSFKAVDQINDVLGRHGNLASDGRPILGMDAKDIARIIWDVCEDCFIVPAHVWTPWFSVFGSMSGFDKIEDCFEELTPKIYCLETGLSSDPAMNWRLSALDRFSLISNSDSHSPSKIGREANVFNCELEYNDIVETLKKKDKNKFLYTVEFFPQEGKYHFDGHRACDVRLSPEETKKHKGICPKCGRRITVGVMNRVDQLADRPDDFIPDDSIPFKNLIPLDEIISEARGVGKTSKTVMNEYLSIISKFGNEFEVLLKAPKEKLFESLSSRIAEGVVKVREGKVKILPGYDGEYGKVEILSSEEKEKPDKQLSLF